MRIYVIHHPNLVTNKRGRHAKEEERGITWRNPNPFSWLCWRYIRCINVNSGKSFEIRLRVGPLAYSRYNTVLPRGVPPTCSRGSSFYWIFRYVLEVLGRGIAMWWCAVPWAVAVAVVMMVDSIIPFRYQHATSIFRNVDFSCLFLHLLWHHTTTPRPCWLDFAASSTLPEFDRTSPYSASTQDRVRPRIYIISPPWILSERTAKQVKEKDGKEGHVT